MEGRERAPLRRAPEPARSHPAGAPLDRRRFLLLGAAAIGAGALLGLRAFPALGTQLRDEAVGGADRRDPAAGGADRRDEAAGGADRRDGGGADRRDEAVEILMRSDRTGARVWFEPRGAVVRVGRPVRWVNESGVHTVTAYHPENGRPLRLPTGADAWDSGYLVESGATFELTPGEPGVYDFFCRPHEAAGMVGRLVVLQPDGAAPGEPDYPAASGDGRLPEAAAAAFPSVREILAAPPGS